VCQLIGRSFLETAMGILPLDTRSGEINDDNAGEKHHEREHDDKSDAASAAPISSARRSCHNFGARLNCRW
jgi:hypothetical protein